MKKSVYIFLLLAIVCLCLMRWITVKQQAALDDADTLAVERLASQQTERVAAVRTVVGRIGDGTGMSCIEFITLDGDTFMLSKVSEYTGEEAQLLGTLSVSLDNIYQADLTDQDEALSTAVNLTELRTQWLHDGQGFVLAADSSCVPVPAQNNGYKHWHLQGSNLVITREVSHESGTTEVLDTLRIVSLTPDTLLLQTPLGNTIAYTH